MTKPTVLFAWRRTPPPFLIGGAEVSQQLLAEEFAASGWNVLYLGCHEPPWKAPSDLPPMKKHLVEHRIPYEETAGDLRYVSNGVHCRAVRQGRLPAALDAMLRRHAPDLLITAQEGASELVVQARRRGVKVAAWLHSVSSTSLGALHGQPHYALATSRFVASCARAQEETTVVLFYPPFTRPRPGSPATSDALLMINPVPQKGSALLHELIQQQPRQPFTLVEGWWDTSNEFAHYPNVRYVHRTYDMHTLYAQHRLLLVPSVVDDAFPRVIIEAGLHGLPAIGSHVGGIPEAIGSGGVLVPRGASAHHWGQAICGTNRAHLSQRAQRRAEALVRPCLPELAIAGVIA
ncbi:hypothetical protein GCM10010377_75730 [Streptomyces viridiviolaceus]|uniref:Glycosyltransferase n=1 Tax=Streptomyces viridiviolaceus TaxID=68282 RepID=A0ABW2DYH4_9ACTN|nr:glycosyltransferase [Streptomyces viridiviolaceus]GHB74198.1 hypothetical protein GCM10010377_75730 [Streptomyces viridiviolaceus]